MKSLRTILSSLLLLNLGAFALPVHALDDLLITEFMAQNDNTLADEDGDFPDWIEIYNAGTNAVNLNGWYLTDSASDLSKWRFPATNLAVNSYLVVFASGKDRRVVGRPLHTDFKLNNSGDYLALVKPDGSTVQSAYSPAFPLQVPDVSYGMPVVLTTKLLVSNGTPANFTVPLNDALGVTWILPGFNDSSWAKVTNGVGFEGGGPGVVASTLIADSVADFGANQGSNGWSYGYWDKKADANGVYEPGDFTAFPRGTGNILSATNYWNGTKWDWPTAGPATELTAQGGQPAGDNGNPANPVHWVVRRYVSEANGPLRLNGTLACASTNTLTGNIPGSCGDGVVGHIFVDGTEVFTRAVFGMSLGYSLIVNASIGSTIDFALDPGAANDDRCDTNAVFTAAIRTAADAGMVADTIADWSDTGVQGYRGWTYGYFIKTNSTAAYTPNRFSPFPSGTGPNSTANFWDGELWHWFEGDPPFDTIGLTSCEPSIFASGGTNALEHWVIRRWVSEISGTVFIDWHFSKTDLTGGGATAKIIHNGTQRDSILAPAADFVGTTKTAGPFAVQAGDVIDFTVEPGQDIVGDHCLLNATVYGVTTLSNQFRSDVGTLMTNINATAYLRIPFTVSNAATVNTLTLRMKYDDGFVAYLNGSAVASRNLAGPTNWNSTASTSRSDAEASGFEEINLTRVRELLQDGNNVLAIQGLNSSPTDPDFLLVAELTATFATANPALRGYFATPTPGSANGPASANIGPLITKVDHDPHDPADTDDLYVTARISSTVNPVGTVRLYYRVMFGSESNVVMLDDGLHQDGGAGDGIYGAVIPNTVSTIGQMVRYYITAADNQGNLTRQPPFPNPNFSAQYFGAVVQNPALTNPLPVLHLFITDANLNAANGNGSARFPCSIYYLGEFYDNLGINLHGQSSQGFPKKSYDIDFNPDHHFLWAPGESRVDDINLLTTYPDKAHMRNILAYDTYRDAGSPYHFTVPVRVQTNGGFWGDWHIVENGDNNWLKRIGRDPNGALYKMYVTFTSLGDTTISLNANAEKKTRKQEGNADLVALYNGLHLTGINLLNFMYDNMNVSEVVNETAARNLTADVDCCHKNYYFYRDTDGTGEWEAMPWDVDLSFGRNWQGGDNPATPTPGDGCSCYWDTNMWADNYVLVGGNNSFWQAIFNTTATRQMYYRRLRTLMDEQLQPTNTPSSELHWEAKINQLADLIGPDGQLDLLKWGTFGNGTPGPIPTTDPQYQNVYQGASVLLTNFLPARRLALYNRTAGNSTEIPNPQPTNVTILIGSLDYNPASGNQAEEYIQLINPNTFAVDISGWTLSGAVDHTFQGGVVIPSPPSSNTLYVVADKKAFRHRATTPRGGMSLYIEGPYKGQLSARGETIILSDKSGRIVRTNTYVGNPSGPQQYLRITEIMYHPPVAPPGSGYEAEDFEYIEFKNIGPTNIDLTGVHFTNGVEFAFPASSLAPGAYVLVVRNTAAFISRYGSAFNIAGQYVGILDNGGENLRVDDAVGEKILDFKYDNKWYPITDGPGASLVIVNENADWRTWNLKESWRPSAHDFGSPAHDDPQPTPVPVLVIINEVLTHTDLPQVDALELLNPNATDADIGGWFLSDDFANPKKFRVPNGTRVPAGGFLVFYESNSFGIGPNAFAFSSKGDESYIYSGDGTNLTGYLQGYAFGAAENGISFGRYTNSQTNVHFVAQSALTLGAPNAAPKVGPVVISEINYHPPQGLAGADNSLDEYVELANITAAPLPLYDTNHPANTWRLRSAVDFNFPAGVTLAVGGHALVVSFSPADTPKLAMFRARFSISASVPIFGPFSGQLANEGESVRLYRPDTPETNTVPYILVDQIDYSNLPPWPSRADGSGPSLQRVAESAYGNDPINWIAVGPSAGAPYVAGGTPPSITTPPADTTVVAGRVAMFTVNVAGTAPFFYQWLFNGQVIPGANSATLILPAVQPKQAGSYSVVVYNSVDSIESQGATLTILIPASITQQPANLTVRAGSNAVFSVSGTSSTPISYQWFFNGNAIPGATSTTLTINNATNIHEGTYKVRLTDSVGSIDSVDVTLRVLIVPYLLAPLPPISIAAAPGETLTLGVQTFGSLPVWTRWRLFRTTGGGQILVDQTNSQPFGYYTFTVATNSGGAYTVILTNAAGGSVSVAWTNTLLTVLTDSNTNGIPDVWEAAYFGSPTGVTNRDEDFDGDGLSNWQEYIAGTDPTDPTSYLKVRRISASGGALIEFNAVSNRTYSVEYKDAVDAALWRHLADVVGRSTNWPASVLDPNPGSNRFYHLVTPRRP